MALFLLPERMTLVALNVTDKTTNKNLSKKIRTLTAYRTLFQKLIASLARASLVFEKVNILHYFKCLTAY